MHWADAQRTVVSFPNIRLVIAEEGPARKALDRQVTHLRVQHNVLFVNYLPRGPELWDCFCAGDVFVFASSTETQGLVLLEAMALGVPLVSTAAMRTKDIVSPQRGVLVAEERVDDFAGKVLRLLGEQDLRARLRRDGQQFARGWVTDNMTFRMTEFYASVIAQAKDKRRGAPLDLAPAKQR